MSQGDNIRALRKREGLTQQQLAEVLGVKKETVCRWEKGHVSIKVTTMKALCEHFNVAFDDLASEEHGLASPGKDKTSAPSTNDSSSQDETCALYHIVYAGGRGGLKTAGQAPVLHSLAAKHPGCFFVRMGSSAMSRCYPQGSLLLVDPNMKPWNGCSVIALCDTSSIVIRRYSTGTSMIILSSYSYRTAEPDMVLDKRRVRILGVVVWFQASHDLNYEQE